MNIFFRLCITQLLILLGCSFIQDCPEGINRLPMYGNAKKCPEQIESDRRFIKEMDRLFGGDRKRASQDRAARAWNYYNKNVADTAMMRFNQAWLLDSTNADVYWGFGNLLGKQEKFQESLPFFRKSLALNPDNPRVWEAAAQSYGNMYGDTRDKNKIDSCLYFLRGAFARNPKSIGTISRLTIAYTYAMQKDSAVKYLEVADRIDKRLVRDEIRTRIKSMK